jgi:hypothetical protein
MEIVIQEISLLKQWNLRSSYKNLNEEQKKEVRTAIKNNEESSLIRILDQANSKQINIPTASEVEVEESKSTIAP